MTNMMRVLRSAVEEMAAHAREEAPLECCGLLAGINDLITRVYRTDNDAKSTSRYFVNPTQQFKAHRDMDANGLEMLGAYHSHPGSSPTPSSTDKDLAFIKIDDETPFQPWYPDCLYFIVSLGRSDGPSLRAFWPREGDFEPAEFVIVEADEV